MQSKQSEFCFLEPHTLLQRAQECQVHVIGTLKTIFMYKRYIIDVFLTHKLVARVFKRYSDFEAFYELTRMNFKNIDLGIGQFPSKFHIFGKDEYRKKYFEKFLNAILKTYCETPSNKTNQRLINTMYAFLVEKNDDESGGVRNQKSSISSNEKDTSGELSSAEDKILLATALFQSKMKGSSPNDLLTNLPRQFAQDPFLVRFEDEDEWRERYLKLEGSSLKIYKHKNDNDFGTQMEIYQAKVEYLHREPNWFDLFCQKMEFNHNPTFTQNEAIISISHDYDYSKLLIKETTQKGHNRIFFEDAKTLITKTSQTSTIEETFEGVFDPIGKIMIVFYALWSEWPKPKSSTVVFLRLRTPSFVYETKRMLYTTEKLRVKQAFLIPISSTYENIIVEVIFLQSQGFIRDGKGEQHIGSFRIPFADYLTYPHGYGLDKTTIKMDSEAENDIHNTFVELSIKNHSHFSSIYSDSFANYNDGNLLTGIQTNSTDGLILTVDRVLRILGSIAIFIQAFWRNVYLFKYPRMGYIFFSMLGLLFALGSAENLFQVFLGLLFSIFLYNSPVGRIFIDHFMNEYIFKYRNEKFIPPEMIGKSQVKFNKWAKLYSEIKKTYHLTLDGKYEKNSDASKAKYEEYWIEKDGKVFFFKEELPGLLEKVFQAKKTIELVFRLISAFVNTFEKICNLFCWADTHRTLFILSLLFLISNIANVLLLRGIGLLFCVHRLWKGKMFFAKIHYAKNKKLTIHSLRYVINKEFVFLNQNHKLQMLEDSALEEIIGEMSFPIQDQQKAKNLKNAIESLIGVYIDVQDLAKRALGKPMKLQELIKMITTCESRLKLQWITGKEGTSHEFQELKAATKQAPIMDLWLQSLLINFILNIPSQLYTSFRQIRSSKAVKFERHVCEKQFSRVLI